MCTNDSYQAKNGNAKSEDDGEEQGKNENNLSIDGWHTHVIIIMRVIRNWMRFLKVVSGVSFLS